MYYIFTCLDRGYDTTGNTWFPTQRTDRKSIMGIENNACARELEWTRNSFTYLEE
jgi:hypothetical protein